MIVLICNFPHYVTEQSSAPGRPDIIDYDNRSVDLKWTPPALDGGVPIEKYIIEKKDKYEQSFDSFLEFLVTNSTYLSPLKIQA